MSKLLAALAAAGAALRAVRDEDLEASSIEDAIEKLEDLTGADLVDDDLVRERVDLALKSGLEAFTDNQDRRYGVLAQKVEELGGGNVGSGKPAIVPPESGSALAGINPLTENVNLGADRIDAAVGVAPGPGNEVDWREGGANEEQGRDATFSQPVADVTDPGTQGDTALAAEQGEHIVPGAAAGPDDAGVVRNDHGQVADAPAGSYDAAAAGVVKDDTNEAVTSTGTADGPVTGEATPGADAEPDWSGFDSDPENWTDDQEAAFAAWYDAHADEPDLTVDHEGVQFAIDDRREAAAQDASAGTNDGGAANADAEKDAEKDPAEAAAAAAAAAKAEEAAKTEGKKKK